MTNAEFCIKNGIRFIDLNARRCGDDKKSKICDYEIMNVIETIGAIRISPDNGGGYALKKWLDLPHYEKPILDDAERRYLKAVIRPWRNRVEEIHRTTSKEDNTSCIVINLRRERVTLPDFVTDTMYEGMAENKAYTLEELGL